MTLLSMVQDVADALGIVRPSSVIANPDSNVRQLLSLANTEGEELASAGDWAELREERTFTTTASAEQFGELPDDFDHIVNDTMFNRTTRRKVHGPLTPEQWQREQANGSATVAEDFFIWRGTNIYLTPTPPAGEVIAFEYISNRWCQSAAGARQSSWTADSDIGRIPEKVMKLGVIWRWRKAKGLDYGEDMVTYERAKARALGRSGGAAKLHLSNRPLFRHELANVPDGDFPGPA